MLINNLLLYMLLAWKQSPGVCLPGQLYMYTKCLCILCTNATGVLVLTKSLNATH